MKKYILFIFLFAVHLSKAQHPIPADSSTKRILLWGATAHIGNGKIIQKSAVLIAGGKLVYVQDLTGFRPNRASYDTLIELTGKHVYPGFIAMGSQIGLNEIELVRSTLDSREVGTINPSSRTLIAYNTDSRVTPTVRSNGVLQAQIAPEGSLVNGLSSVVMLDAWNWEDACIKADEGLWISWPRSVLINVSERYTAEDQEKRYAKSMDNLTSFFDAAYAYSKQQNPTEKNLNLEAMRPVFAGKTKVYFQANYAKDIITAINFLNRYRVKMVLVDGADSWKVTDLLKENNVPVIIKRTQALPMRDDDDIDLPYKLPALLKAKGVDFAITDEGFWKVRNLPFEAGTAVGYGLSKEDALTSITLAPAKILGIDATTGSLEDGKDATLFVSTGDALDMTTNNVEMAFIQGRQIEVFNFQQELYERYMRKYKLPLPNGN